MLHKFIIFGIKFCFINNIYNQITKININLWNFKENPSFSYHIARPPLVLIAKNTLFLVSFFTIIY